MAFTDQSKQAHPFALTAAIVLQGVAVYALIHGFAVSFVPEVTAILKARNIPAETSPPPQNPQSAANMQADPVPQKQVDPMLDRVSMRDPVMTDFKQISDQQVEVRLPDIAPPLLDPTPTFPPRMAMPRGNPGDWATTNDYPARDLREGNQGIAHFLLTIGADGRVQSCRITQSTGFSGLDDATCRNVSRRARFEAATDGTGASVSGTYSGSIRWVIPRD
ncbi:MAG TPA: TonB family protein [Novosphingobium sp.]